MKLNQLILIFSIAMLANREVCSSSGVDKKKHPDWVYQYELEELADNPKSRDMYGNNILHYAASHNFYRSLWRYIAQGADVNARGGNMNATPLHLSIVYFGKLGQKVSKQLLRCGADPNLPDILGDTPLHLAAMKKDWIIARLLLAHGADPDKQNDGGYTALMFVVCLPQTRITKLLLSYRANPELKTLNGLGPLYFSKPGSKIRTMLQKSIAGRQRSRWEKKPLRIEWIEGCVQAGRSEELK